MIQTIYNAGDTALHYFRTSPPFITKEDGSPQSIADLETEACIKESLEWNYTEKPSCFFSEETEDKTVNDDTEIVFVADPIDGTTNYLGENDNWGITLSAFKSDDTEFKQPLASIIYRPTAEETLWTSSEEGYKNANKTYLYTGPKDAITKGEAIATQENEELDSLQGKLTTIHMNHDLYSYENALRDELQIIHRAPLRYNGSTALSMARVAGKGSDGMVCLGELNTWDVAAGTQLAKASGCTIVENTIKNKDGEDVPCLIVAKSAPIAKKLKEAAEQALDPTISIDPKKTKSTKIKTAKLR